MTAAIWTDQPKCLFIGGLDDRLVGGRCCSDRQVVR